MSHRGQDEHFCGNWTIPCHSVRQAVKISNANDVIYIDYAKGRPYKECERLPAGNHTIILNKSLSFHGFNGSAILHCEQTYPFFGINNAAYTTTQVTFFNLSLATRGDLVDGFYNISSTFELGFNFCNIERSKYFIKARSLSCSIRVHNSTIQSHDYPIRAECTNLTVRLTESLFSSCPVYLSTFYYEDTLSLEYYKKQQAANIRIYNCTFIPTERQLPCHAFVMIGSTKPAVFEITIRSTIFMNINTRSKIPSFAGITISSIFPGMQTTSIILDRLHFENINCRNGVVSMQLTNGDCNNKRFNNIGIFNSMFINTNQALILNINRVKLYNNTFNISHGIFGKESLINLIGGSYYFSSCRFYHMVPLYNPAFAVIHIESSVTVKFQDCLYESYPVTETSCDGNFSNINMFYVISYNTLSMTTAQLDIEGNFTIICPQSYKMILNNYCSPSSDKTVTTCDSLFALCIQCPRKTYSLDKGEVHNLTSNRITCHECPVGGNCLEGQVTSKPNFWGYESNREIKFLQCPPQYCCDTERCKHYNSCQGNRLGTLCGKCPSGMSESLFDPKCKPNKDCTSVLFWPAISVYLILYLLFFLYQEDIVTFVQKHFITQTFLPSRNGQNSKPGGLVKIIFYYYQIVQLLRHTDGSGVKVIFVDGIETYLSRAVNFLIVGIPSLHCPFKDLRPVQKAIIVRSIGYSLLILLCVFYVFAFFLKMAKKLTTRSTQEMVAFNEPRDRRSGLKHNVFHRRIAGAFANISLLMYASSTQLCLSLLHCVKLEEHKVLFLDGNIKCYETFQYFLLAYLISTILPFCLVPVLGSYLLKFRRIGVKQFCAACIFPLPFCCFWLYLLLTKCGGENQTYNTFEENENAFEQSNNEIPIADSNETTLKTSESAILGVLLGPFRCHKDFMCFPSSQIPWEGFLIFRRLVLIIVLTFVQDIQLRLFLALILLVAILILHMFVNPFQRKRDNVLESFSLAIHVIFCGSTSIKVLYYGEDSPVPKSLSLLNMIENILTITPLSIIMILVIFSIIIKLGFCLTFCVSILIRNARRLPSSTV